MLALLARMLQPRTAAAGTLAAPRPATSAHSAASAAAGYAVTARVVLAAAALSISSVSRAVHCESHASVSLMPEWGRRVGAEWGQSGVRLGPGWLLDGGRRLGGL